MRTKKVTDVDSNFKVKTKLKVDGVKFYPVSADVFSVHGITFDDGCFRRMPQKIADSVNEGVSGLNLNTAGGRVRFVTTSDYVVVAAKLCSLGKMPHFALTGSAGFDVYAAEDGEDIYRGSIVPAFDIKERIEGEIDFGTSKERLITINFPSYSGVKELFIGIRGGCKIEKAPDYKYPKPVVFYGSSITQGGCCSRPGNTYEQILSRRLGFDYINLGFSGSARAEDEMAKYIKKLDMSVFVYDYDHNAPDITHLEKTHEKFFKAIRKANPDLPVIMLSRPKFHLNSDEVRRLEVVKRTYDNAVKNGDKNVYFIPGTELIKEDFRECATVDDCHPNDSGFLSMALVIEEVLKKIL